MVLFFNLENLEKEAAGDHYRFVSLLKQHYTGRLGMFSSKAGKLSLVGQSFLLNPAPIFNSANTYDIQHIVQYMKLAARRDYTLFKFHRVATLDTSFFPDIDLSKLASNPLLKVVNKYIQFKFEEEYNGISIRKY